MQVGPIFRQELYRFQVVRVWVSEGSERRVQRVGGFGVQSRCRLVPSSVRSCTDSRWFGFRSQRVQGVGFKGLRGAAGVQLGPVFRQELYRFQVVRV